MTTTQTEPSINETDIQRFLAFLNGKETAVENAHHVFQIRGTSVHHSLGLFSGDLRKELIRENAAGAAIDVLVNESDLAKNRYTAENIIGVRHLFVDVDHAEIAEGGLPPSATVKTARGHHLYWTMCDCPVEDFTALQARLIAYYRADPAVKNINRFMRVPGFLQHGKTGETSIPSITSLNPERIYKVKDVLTAYPAPAAPLSPRSARLLETIPAEEGGRNTDFYSRSRTLAERGETPEAVLEKAAEVAAEIGFPVDEALTASGNGLKDGLSVDPQVTMARAITELATAMKDLRSAPSRRPEPKLEGLYQAQSLSLAMVADLMILPKPEYEWLVDGLLPRVGSSILSAPSKFGKSLWARSLAVAIANGDPFFGRSTSSGPVIYLGTEEDPWQVKEHFLRLDLKDHSRIFVHTGMSPRFLATLRQLEVAARLIKPALIIFDTMVNIAEIEDFNSFSEVYNAVKNIRELGNAVGAHVLCIHHNNKSGVHGLNAMMGSEAFKAVVDCPITCWEDDKRKWIEAKPRYAKSLPPTEIIFDDEKLCWSIGRGRTEISEGDYAVEVWDAVTQYLTDRTEGAALEDIRIHVKRDKGKVKRLLDSQVALDRLIKEGRGTPGRPWTYRLPATPSN